MKLSLNWINQYIKVADIPLDDLVKKLTLSTCEVEEVIPAFPDLDKLIVARVESLEKHPDADRLNVCQVFDGKNRLQVICGASNVRAGIHVMFAPVGITLENSQEPLKIEKRKIRGVESSGMICAPSEAGAELLFPNREGILILDDEELILENGPARPEKYIGKPVSSLLPVTDTILDIDNKSITHRPDLWCHFGFAREVAAIYRRDLIFDPLQTQAPSSIKALESYKIEIRSEAALGYSGLSATGINVGPSPLWLRARLAAVGQKSINNIVDASNYVMLELAQPNHAFDRKKLNCSTIAIDKAGKNVKVDTLDDESTEVPENSVLILAEGGSQKKSKPVAVGGIIGGSETAISDETTEIFLESATFPRELIRRTLSRLSNRTDSAVRFEKGQDPAKMIPALYRLSEIISRVSPKARFGSVVKSGDTRGQKNTIKTSLGFLQSRLGFPISVREVSETMQRLFFQVSINGQLQENSVGSAKTGNSKQPAKKATKKKTAKGKASVSSSKKKSASASEDVPESVELKFTAPTFRSQYDVSIPEDIIEELGRIYGYDNIPEKGPAPELISVPLNEKRNLEIQIKNTFRSHGFYETLNYSFCSQKDNQPYGNPGLRILNPVNASQDRMRLSQIPGILRQAALNQNRFDSVRLLELGRIFEPPKELTRSAEKNLPRERNRLSFVSLPDEEKNASESTAFDEFLRMRSILEAFLAGCNVQYELKIPEQKQFYLHPGCQLEIRLPADKATSQPHAETLLGYGGLIHPGYAGSFELKRPGTLFDLDFDVLQDRVAYQSRQSFYRPPGNQPDSLFEFTVVLKKDDSTARPLAIVEALKIQEIQDIALKTIYRGAPLEADEMAVSYRVRASRHNETLAGKDSQKILDSIIAALESEKIPLRS
ncbi:MAG: phenylalanine--tRNA ligase subunit beta [Leptospiraceae bacterium]